MYSSSYENVSSLNWWTRRWMDLFPYLFQGGGILHDQEFKSFLLSLCYNSVRALFNFLELCTADETAMNWSE